MVTDALELSTYADVTIYVMRQNVTKKNMTALLNNAVKRGELSNVSIILNGFENKAKYGAYYGYGHGYGTYDKVYYEDKKTKGLLKKITKRLKF